MVGLLGVVMTSDFIGVVSSVGFHRCDFIGVSSAIVTHSGALCCFKEDVACL